MTSFLPSFSSCVFYIVLLSCFFFFFFQAEDGIRDHCVTGVQTCALPICCRCRTGCFGWWERTAPTGQALPPSKASSSTTATSRAQGHLRLQTALNEHRLLGVRSPSPSDQHSGRGTQISALSCCMPRTATDLSGCSSRLLNLAANFTGAAMSTLTLRFGA